MHITLIGMSNIGKSYWTSKLASGSGFLPIDCDDLIGDHLKSELPSSSLSHVKALAAWMGLPYEAHYAEASRKYLAAEFEVMKAVIERVKKADPSQHLVIDTAGSVIYLDRSILQELGTLTKIVYLEASQQHVGKLFQRFFKSPKPLIWGDAFRQDQDETPRQALARCYKDLLEQRAKLYAAAAHVMIPFEDHMRKGFDFLSYLRSSA